MNNFTRPSKKKLAQKSREAFFFFLLFRRQTKSTSEETEKGSFLHTFFARVNVVLAT